VLEEECHGTDDHGDRADLHEHGSGALHLQQEGASLLLAQRSRHPQEADDRQDAPDDEEEVERIAHVQATFQVGGCLLLASPD